MRHRARVSEGNARSAEAPAVVQALVDNHRRFRAFLESRVRNDADAEDILQAAFVKGLAKGDTVRREESVVAWCYRLLRNAIVDHHRHLDAERRALSRIAGFAGETVEPESEVERAICQCLYDILPTMREEQAELLRRVDLEGVSIGDVARETGTTSNNVRVRLHRARTALRQQLELCCGSCTEHGCLDCTCKHSSH